MNHIKISKILLALFAVVLCFGTVGFADPLGTAFTYQGRLIDANKAADGLYDMQFKLFDAVSGGSKVGPDVNVAEVDVVDGYFTVALDFGNVFNGNNRWLEIGVRPGDQNDPNVYTTLDPRQKITPTPYALHVKNISVMDANNILVGEGTGTVGTGNVFAGYQAGISNTGSYNTFLGYMAGHSSNSASFNIFLGDRAGYSNQDGYCNTFLGHCAGYANQSGYYNTFTGYYVGGNNSGGAENTFSGYRAGVSNTGGSDNTFMGCYAGQNNTNGFGNTFLGASAGSSNSGGSNNVFIGYQAGSSETGSNKLYIANSSSDTSILIYGDFSTRCVGIGTKTPARSLHVSDVMRLQPRAIAPSSPAEGDIYMNSSTHKLMVYDGTTWQACW